MEYCPLEAARVENLTAIGRHWAKPNHTDKESVGALAENADAWADFLDGQGEPKDCEVFPEHWDILTSWLNLTKARLWRYPPLSGLPLGLDWPQVRAHPHCPPDEHLPSIVIIEQAATDALHEKN